jgi:hypothetical protein
VNVRRLESDTELLRRSAEAADHAAAQAWIHMEAEYVGDVPKLMDTLGAQGPYAYTIVPQVLPGGVIKMPVATSREEIEECYKFVRGRSDLLASEAMIELRGSWYVFAEAMNRGRTRATGVLGESITYALFPSAAGKGITGELVWAKMPREPVGDPRDPVVDLEGVALRRHMVKAHDRYLQGLRDNDVEGVLSVMNECVYAAVRDYVNDTGALTNLDAKEGHRAYYQALLAKYDVQSVTLMDRVVQDDYVFAELRLTVRNRASDETVAFHTAEFFVPGRDARFTVRIGHGTDPAPV